MNQKHIKISNVFYSFKLNGLNNIDEKMNYLYSYQQIRKWKFVSRCIREELMYSSLPFSNLKEKHNYKKLIISIGFYFILNEKKEIVSVKSLFFLEKYKKALTANILVNDRFLEIEFTPDFFKLTAQEIKTFIHHHLKTQSAKKLSLRITLTVPVIKNHEMHPILRKIKNSVFPNNNQKENNKILKACSNNIKKHHDFFQFFFLLLLKNGLFNNEIIKPLKIHYSITNEDFIKWQICLKLLNNNNIIEKWSNIYELRIDDMENFINSLCDSSIVDRVFKNYEIDKMNDDDLKMLIQFSNMNHY